MDRRAVTRGRSCAEKTADAAEPGVVFPDGEQSSDKRNTVSPRAGARTKEHKSYWLGRSLAPLIVAGGAVAVIGYVLLTSTSGNRVSSSAQIPPASNEAAAINLPPPDLLRPLSPEEATKENSKRPFVNRPDTAAAKFVLHAPPEDRERAINCLTQAVYYEAEGEGPDGQRAVAQVVINRMRHPGFPASICGVVYQGSERGSGCQFTFTCDGSLLRAPVADLWTRARKIAQEALSGKVFAPVGHATHYHADYVLPYWADSLDKSLQIGRHIFYRLRGSFGERNAFSQRYAGSEPEARAPDAALILPESATAQLAGALLGNDLNGPAKNVEKASQPPAPSLAADVSVGSLIADGGTPVTKPHRQKAPSDCPADADSKRISPMGKADMRAGSSSAGC